MASSVEVRPPSERTIPFITLPAWVYAAKHCGFEIEPVLRELGLELDIVHLEARGIRETSLQQLMLACVARARAHHFPFVLGQTLTFEYLPELQTFLQTSPTPRHALRAFLWIRGLLNPGIGVRLEERGEFAWLWFEFGGATAEGAAGVYFSETRMVMMQNLARLHGGGPPPIERVWFRHPAPSYVAQYASYLEGALAFERPEYGLEFPRAVLDLPLARGHSLLHRQAELRLAQKAQQGPRAQGVAARLLRAFTSNPELMRQGIQGIARRLRVHPRTLQRRLREEGDNFVELLARQRMQLASTWLHQRSADIDTIAARLGYADRRSFSRAFTRWAGVSPSHYRRLSAPPAHDREPTDVIEPVVARTARGRR